MATNMTTVLKASVLGLAQPLNPNQFSRRRSDGALFFCLILSRWNRLILIQRSCAADSGDGQGVNPP